ncbi:Midasin, related [Eimeria praecox]|uniref:Midasin n=1 Tax=Eimeria praecox TaxID=51316 RepID=U6GWV4_9EIME|nr:Midasin, related [Eimeria praecox]
MAAGSWVCGRRAGDFEWQEGILTRCVREGRWIVIEQLQQLAQDVHALLHGLIATGRLTVHEQQQELRVHPDFALFATLAATERYARSSKRGKRTGEEVAEEGETAEGLGDESLDVALTASPPPLSPLLESWVLLHVPPPSVADIQQIVVHSFPAVAPVAARLQKAFHAAAAAAEAGLARPGLPPPRAARLPQLRDFVKLCRRLQTLATASSSGSTSIFEGFLTERLRLRIVEEAATVLLGHLSDRKLRLRATMAFAALWDVHEQQVETLLFSQRPTLRETAEAFHSEGEDLVGRWVPRHERPTSKSNVEGDDILALGEDAGEATGVASATSSPGAAEGLEEPAAGAGLLTGQQLRLVQQAGGALHAEEPLLFVGDTGAGKTFIVSYLAERLGRELVVVNLHRQSEGEDLVGRWVPRHPPHEVAHLWRQLLHNASVMLGTAAEEEGAEARQGTSGAEAPKAKKRKQQQQQHQSDSSPIESARQMMLRVGSGGSSLLQREAYLALLRLAAAANNALLQLLRRCGNMLPIVRPAAQKQQQEQQQEKQRERMTAGELLARFTELQASFDALLEDPALTDCSASTPRKFESLVDACGLREFLPAAQKQQQEQQQEKQRERMTAGELLARFTELQASFDALLEDPALTDCSASTPRKFESLVDACGLREFLPAAGGEPETEAIAATTAAVAASGGARKRRNQLHFVFTEGPLVEAVRTGKWLLLDEINLAPPDLLQRLLGLLEEPQEPLLLLEGGKPRLVYRHPDFRVFACMNPPILAPPLRLAEHKLAEHKLSFEDDEEPRDTDETLEQQEEQHERGKQVSADGSAGVGKRELPAEVRQRFTELYVDETEGLEDIITVVDAHLRPLSADPPSRLVAEVYLHLRCLAEAGQLLDGNNKTPCYSLRTLSRSLLHAAAVVRRPVRPLQLRAALKDGFLALFGSSLSPHSAARVDRVLSKAFKPAVPGEGVTRPPAKGTPAARSGQQQPLQLQVLPAVQGGEAYVSVEGFIIRRGGEPIDVEALKKKFVLTPSSEVYVHRVLRLLSGSRCALLLEGPTSCGKTSLVSFLAAATGHKCIRINNHENTDIQDYVGSYTPDAEGRLVFAEGPLTLAVRLGWWVLIDELNLAPSDVLEALNRLLDSNRELILPATGEVVSAHKDFQLFGTQNPAGIGVYGGRKVLSRALANRFLQLQMTQFATEDLRQILLTRCSLPSSRVEPMLRVYMDLQQRRANSSVFFGAHGFMTIRDLVRWGRRVGNSPFQHMLQQQKQQQKQKEQEQHEQVQEYAPMSFEEVALEGWLLVGERLRTEEDRAVVPAARAAAVREAPEGKRREAEAAAAAAASAAEAAAAPELPAFLPFSFNAASLRLLALTLRALVAGENILLVGDTGAGKTAVCELIAWTLQQQPHQQHHQQKGQQQEQQGEEALTALESGLLQRLSPNGMYVYNCHLQMEASELLGCMSPVHQGELLQQQQHAAALQQQILQMLEHPPPPGDQLPDCQQLRQSSEAAAETTLGKASTVVAEGGKSEGGNVSASGLLMRFYQLLQTAAEDVVICLRAHRDRGGLEMGDEDTNLFFRALSKAARQAQQMLQQETDEAASIASQKEAHCSKQLEAAKRTLQQEQSKHQQLLLQLQEEKQRQQKQQQEQHQALEKAKRKEHDSTGGDGGTELTEQSHLQHQQLQQQEGRPTGKKRRKGTRNRAAKETPLAGVRQEVEDAAQKRLRTMPATTAPADTATSARQLVTDAARVAQEAAAETTLGKAATAVAQGGKSEGGNVSASGLLMRFYQLLQTAAEDVVICLRAHRDRGGLEMGDEDTNLFFRALSKAARQAQQMLQQETDEAASIASQKEAHCSRELEAAKRTLQQEQSKHQQLLLQLQEEKQRQQKQQQEQHQVHEKAKRKEHESTGGDGGTELTEQSHLQHQQLQQQEGRPTGKKRRKGTRNRAAKETPLAGVRQEVEDAAQKRLRTMPVTTAPADTATTAVVSAEETVASSTSALAAASASVAALHAAVGGAAPMVKAYTEKLLQRCVAWREACKRTRSLFCWRDGPLIKAMKAGAIFLLDEASLGQDAVLERLNSLLEDGRHILLTEQGAAAASADAGGIATSAATPTTQGATAAVTAGVEVHAAPGFRFIATMNPGGDYGKPTQTTQGAAAAVTAGVEVHAAPGFRFIATMNPGGDYGKRELSPALRNRLTEVYVPAFSFEAPDAALLVLQRLQHTCLSGLQLPHAEMALAMEGLQSEDDKRMKQGLLQLLQQEQPDGSKLDAPLCCLAIRLVLLLRWVRQHIKQPLSIRDALCWVCFIHRFVASQQHTDPSPTAAGTATAKARWAVQGLMHGGCLLLLDGLGVGAEMCLQQAELEALAQGYLEAEANLVKLATERADQVKEEKLQTRLLQVQQEVQQQVADAAAHPTRRPHLGVLLLLKTHGCGLYRDWGLHRYNGIQQQHWEQEKQQHQQAAGPCWSRQLIKNQKIQTCNRSITNSKHSPRSR